MTSEFEVERSKRETGSKKSGKNCGMKAGDFPSPHGEGFLWEKSVYWWWLYTEEDSFSRFCKGRWLENNFSRSWCVQQLKHSCSFSPWSKSKLTTALGEWKFTLVIPWLAAHPLLNTLFREKTCLLFAYENHFQLLLHITRLRCSWCQQLFFFFCSFVYTIVKIHSKGQRSSLQGRSLLHLCLYLIRVHW